jgi:hypothetical protein
MPLSTNPKKTCPDCGKPMKHTSARCKACNLKHQWEDPALRAARVKGMLAENNRRTLPRPNCEDCGRPFKKLGSHLCHSCNGKRLAAINPYFTGEISSEKSESHLAAKHDGFRRFSTARYPESLTETEGQVLLGGLMGDGCLYLAKRARSPCYSECHCEVQKDAGEEHPGKQGSKPDRVQPSLGQNEEPMRRCRRF